MADVIRTTLVAGLMVALLSACREEGDALAAAQADLARKDDGAARIHLMTAIRQHPDLALARYLMGSLMLRQGNAESAAIELAKARELGHPAEQVLAPLARALVQRGEYRKVVQLGAEAAGLPDETWADVQTSVATAQFALKNKIAGEAALEEALRLAPAQVAGRLLRTQRLAVAGDLDAALAYAGETLALAPDDAKAWLAKADLLAVRQGSGDEAIAAYRKVLELNGPSIRAHTGILGLLLAARRIEAAQQQLEALRKDQPQHPAGTYYGAQLALLRGDTGAARAAADKLLAAAPTDPTYSRLAAAVSLETGELAKAVSQLAGAVQANPSDRALRRLLVLALVRSGQGHQALEAVQPLLQDKQADPDAMALAAVASLQTGDRARAEKLFNAAAKLKPGDPHVRAALAMGRLGTGDGPAAMAELQGLAQADSGGGIDTVVISAYLQRRDFDRAQRAIDALARKRPQDPTAAMLRGELHLRRGDVAAARKSYEEAAALAPTNFAATGALARLDLTDKQPAQARQRFERLLSRDPHNADALVALAKLNRMTGAPAEDTTRLLAEAVRADPMQPGTRMLQVEHELEQGNWRAALSAAEAAARAMPDDTRLLALHGRASMAAREYGQATSLFGKLVALRPTEAEPQQQLARAQLALQRPDQARQALQQAIRLAPAALDVQADLARLEISTHRLAEARRIARRLQQQQPADPIGLLLEGEVAAAERAWPAAEAAYTAALAKPTRRSRAAIGLHAVLVKAGKTAQAEALSARWLREQPRDAEFARHLADRALLAQDFPRAEALYQRVLREQPDNALALNNLAWAAHNLKRPDALRHAEQAVKLRPGEAAYQDTLAQLLAREGRLDQALRREARAVEIAPDSPAYRLELARLYARSGDKPRARAELDRLGGLAEPFAAQAQEVRKLL